MFTCYLWSNRNMLSRHMCEWVKCVLSADFQKTNHCEDSGNITYIGKVGVQQIILAYVPLILKKNTSIVLGNKSVSEPGLCLLCSISQSICNEQQQSRAQLKQLRKLTCLVVCRVWYSVVLYYCCCCFVIFLFNRPILSEILKLGWVPQSQLVCA